MFFTSPLLMVLINLLTLTIASLAEGEEGHTRAISMVSPTAVPSMVPHYLGHGIVAHVPANATWIDQETSQPLSKRDGLDTAGVYMCSEKNWGGSCYWQQAGGGACHTYPFGRESSFGVDMNLQCATFRYDNCKGDQYTDITWPGTGDLTISPYTWWLSKPGSFMCRHCVGCIYGNAPGWVIN